MKVVRRPDTSMAASGKLRHTQDKTREQRSPFCCSPSNVVRLRKFASRIRRVSTREPHSPQHARSHSADVAVRGDGLLLSAFSHHNQPTHIFFSFVCVCFFLPQGSRCIFGRLCPRSARSGSAREFRCDIVSRSSSTPRLLWTR